MALETRRAGFALPLTILLTLLMTAGLFAGFTRAAREVRELDNYRAETEAFAVAEAGLERYLARVGPLVADTTMVVSGGTARVRATLLKVALTAEDTALYVVRSDGVIAGGGAAVPEARRTVAQLAYRIVGRLPVAAIWTTLGGMEKAGASGTITGTNGCQAVDLTWADGTRTYTYDSCKVATAADRQSRWAQVPNAWVDNWTRW